MPTKQNQSDAFLIQRLQSGDKNALTFLVKKWHKLFCEKAYWLVKDKDIAKDIAQESWLVIMDKINNLKNPEQFKYWAYRIVVNKSTDWLRLQSRQRKKTVKLIIDIKSDDDNYSENQQLKSAMSKAIKDLPHNQKVVIQLFYLQEFSLKQIGKMLDISVGTAKSRLFYAREKLKIILKTRNYEN
ncbi:RNA polymerase sigma factor [Winogradskyella haliclonae]|uniref:RNA polymerase sigma factor n=1 Tax=Winogradskyella haliclonae TaxID=2048558 RepID=A0ABQ2C3T1_9FLAO|nr:RNA polymerase sigma factor [Winogradskyella haliclonae]GGI57788.1 RNA polymerase sigma factor [Winogradskyella haliclonae]